MLRPLKKNETDHERDHNERRYADLLQGLGRRTTCGVQPWLAPQFDSWEAQMVFLASNGYRCVAHDRRGHGRSSQPWTGNEMDTYADDLSELIEAGQERDQKYSTRARPHGLADTHKDRLNADLLAFLKI